jgi:hypothetical protein
MSKKYVVKLLPEEREELKALIHKGKAARWKLQRAQAILAFDQSACGLAWPDSRIAEAYACTTRSLESWRKQAVEQGPLSLLERKPATGSKPKLDGEQEAQLTKLACSEAPKGYQRWSLRLLAERLVELQIVDSISREAVRCALKKRPEAVAEANNVVHSPGAGRGIRLSDGASAGNLQAAVPSQAAGRVHGRAAEAVNF